VVHRREKITWQPDTGAAISEFLIAAPVLLLLLYAVFDLNERLDLKQDLSIAARNIAHSGASTNSVGSLAKDVKNTKVPLSTLVGHATVAEVDKPRIEANLKDLGIGDSYETASAAIGSIASNGAGLLQSVKNISVHGNYLLIPDLPTSFTVSVAGTERTVFQKGMRLLSNIYAKSVDQLIGEDTFNFDHVTLVASRNEAGYHAGSYQYQALPGMFLGQTLDDHKHWGTPTERKDRLSVLPQNAGFMPDCMMHFQGDSQCEPGNILATTLRVAYIVVGIVKTIASLGSDNSSAAAVDEMGAMITDKATSALVEEVEKEANDMAGAEVKKLFDGKMDLENKFKNMSDQMISPAQKALDEDLTLKGVFLK